MEGGCAFSAGINRSRAASTAARSSSKNEGRFIGRRECPSAGTGGEPLGLFLGFGFEGHSGYLAARLLEEKFDLSLRLFQVFLAFAGELYALLEEFHRVVQRKVGALEFSDDFLQTSEGMFEIGFLPRFGLLGRRWIHGRHFSHRWQRGQKKLDRPPCSMRRINAPQRA